MANENKKLMTAINAIVRASNHAAVVRSLADGASAAAVDLPKVAEKALEASFLITMAIRTLHEAAFEFEQSEDGAAALRVASEQANEEFKRAFGDFGKKEGVKNLCHEFLF